MSRTVFNDVRAWLFGDALPFWAAKGIDRVNGGYVEHLRLDGTDAEVPYKRVRVIARQIYVFSHAALFGFEPGAELARHGYEFLTRNAWLGSENGWARRLDRIGCVIDPTPDLYDLAFVLFAFGWYQKLTNDPDAHRWAIRTTDFIEDHMRHSSAEGFLTQKPESGPRLQNPHMHLLEAALINVEASGDVRFRDLADELVCLFEDRLYDSASCTLAEHFEQDWTRYRGDGGRLTEPGHHFEWAWILASYQRLAARDVSQLISELVEFAEAHGVDPVTRLTYDQVRDDGVVIECSSRLWPNAERIQAAVAMFEINGVDPRRTIEDSSRILLTRFLNHEPRGTWIDHFTEAGNIKADRIPASSLYHVMIAFSEMLRVESAVCQAFPGHMEVR